MQLKISTRSIAQATTGRISVLITRRLGITLVGITVLVIISAACSGCGLSVKGASGSAAALSLDVNPGTIGLTPGGSPQAIQVSAAALDGSGSPVNVVLTGLPAGITAKPYNLTLSSGVSQTITLDAAQGVGIGTTEATLVATSGAQSRSTQITLKVAARTPGSAQGGDFSLNVSPGSITLTPGGQSQEITVSVSAADGSKVPVNVVLSGLPAGITGKPSNLTLSPGVSRTITLTASETAGIGTAEATLVATSGGKSLSAEVALTIAAPTSGSTSSGSYSIPLTALTGCTNPNTGTSNGDWGTGGEVPVYLDPGSVDLTAPVYATNTIFWTSRETGPGQSVLMTGAFTPAQKTIKVAVIPPGTTDWQALVSSTGTTVKATQEGTPQNGNPAGPETTWLSFVVPSTFTSGVYGFEIVDPAAPPIFGLANQPQMHWVIGVPSQTDPASALQHQVRDCGAEPGENLRIFGKNFVPSDQVILQSATGQVYRLTASKIDSDSIVAAVPSTLTTGTYDLWVGNSAWDATSSPAGQITIYAPQKYAINTVACPLVGGGTTDNKAVLQACIDTNVPAAGNITYLTLPAGEFAISGTVTPHSYQVLIGESAATTKIVGSPGFVLPQYSGVANLSISGPATVPFTSGSMSPGLITTANVWNSNPSVEGHIYLSGVSIQDTASSGSEQLVVLAGPDIQVYNSYFLANDNQVFDVDLGDGGIISGNTFVLNNWTGDGIEDSQNIIFENNTTESNFTPVPNSSAVSAGSGLSISRGNAYFGGSALSQDIYVGYNTFQNTGMSGQQVVTNDGGGGAYYGPIASSTDRQVILADAPSWAWMGTTNPGAAVLVIVAGTGVGQYAFLSGWEGSTINLATPLQVIPDATSVVTIVQVQYNITVANNTFTNTLGAQVVLQAIQGVIENNTLINSDGGILVASSRYGSPAGFNPLLDVDILNNKLSVGDGNFIATDFLGAGGIGILDTPGSLLSGVLMRGNTIPSQQTMYLTNGWNQLNGVLSEQNTGNWGPTFQLMGLLIQNNTAP
jgi:hypothetical protein